jgi:hypothetical protein
LLPFATNCFSISDFFLPKTSWLVPGSFMQVLCVRLPKIAKDKNPPLTLRITPRKLDLVG